MPSLFPGDLGAEPWLDPPSEEDWECPYDSEHCAPHCPCSDCVLDIEDSAAQAAEERD